MPPTETILGHKDVIIALLGVAAGLSGLVLVFLGLVVTSLDSFGGGTSDAVLKPFRRIVLVSIAAFCIGIACVVSAAFWLIGMKDDHSLYVVTLVLFLAQIVSLLTATIWTSARLAWGG